MYDSKPSPKLLLKILNSVDSRDLPMLYVGNFFEDLLAARNANQATISRKSMSLETAGGKFLFAAIATTESVGQYFLKIGDCKTIVFSVSSVKDLPQVLERARDGRETRRMA